MRAAILHGPDDLRVECKGDPVIHADPKDGLVADSERHARQQVFDLDHRIGCATQHFVGPDAEPDCIAG